MPTENNSIEAKPNTCDIVDNKLISLGIKSRADNEFNLRPLSVQICHAFSQQVIRSVINEYMPPQTGSSTREIDMMDKSSALLSGKPISSTNISKTSFNIFSRHKESGEIEKLDALQQVEIAHHQDQVNQGETVADIGVLHCFIVKEIKAEKLAQFESHTAAGRLYDYLSHEPCEQSVIFDCSFVQALILNHFWETCQDYQEGHSYNSIYAKSDQIDELTKIKLQEFVKLTDHKRHFNTEKSKSFELFDTYIKHLIRGEDEACFNQPYFAEKPRCQAAACYKLT